MKDYTKPIESLTNVAKTYMRISSIKTALTVFLVGYTALKVSQIFIKK
jgi:hypothetical protein